MKEAIDLLKAKGLRRTQVRVDVLTSFLQSNASQDSMAIEQSIGQKIDRITLYRTLNSFIDYGILHKISITNKKDSYALCHGCSSQAHNHSHVHFTCETCEDVICMEEITTPSIQLPEGYMQAETTVLVKGKCPNC